MIHILQTTANYFKLTRHNDSVSGVVFALFSIGSIEVHLSPDVAGIFATLSKQQLSASKDYQLISGN